MPRAFLVKRGTSEKQEKAIPAKGFGDVEKRGLSDLPMFYYGSRLPQRIRSETELSDYSDACTCSARKRFDSYASNSSSTSSEEDTSSDDGVFRNDFVSKYLEHKPGSPDSPVFQSGFSFEQGPQLSKLHASLFDLPTESQGEARLPTNPFPLMLPYRGIFPPLTNLPFQSHVPCGGLPKTYVDPTLLTAPLAPHELRWRQSLDLILGEDEDCKRHQCQVCSKSFRRASSLSNHRLIHKNLKDYKCEDCDMGFLRKSDLAKHVVIHSGSKPYQCDVCHKRFSQSSNMLTHKRRHSGVRPYSCAYCGKSFYRKVDVRRHSSVHREF